MLSKTLLCSMPSLWIDWTSVNRMSTNLLQWIWCGIGLELSCKDFLRFEELLVNQIDIIVESPKLISPLVQKEGISSWWTLKVKTA